MNARAITKALGGRWQGRFGLARCPTHADRTPSLKVCDDLRKLDGIDVHCFAGCSWQDIKAELHRQGLIEDGRGHRHGHRRDGVNLNKVNHVHVEVFDHDDLVLDRVELALSIWQASVSLADTLGWRYFTERRELRIGLLDDLSHCLRWHERIGAVIALMTDPVTNQQTGVHRTFLNPDATKRERKMLGRQGVIRLSPDVDVLEGLGICEGIEDGLSILLSGWAPVWVATSATAIQNFPVLSGIETLTIFYDNDTTGRTAALACKDRWVMADREVRLSRVKDAFQ
jgi:hypothetical protein